MSRFYLSILTKPPAAYIPSKFVPGLSSERRKCSTATQKSVTVPDPRIHGRDLDFIASLWVIEETKCDSSSDESEQEEDAVDPNTTGESKADFKTAVTTYI